MSPHLQHSVFYARARSLLSVAYARLFPGEILFKTTKEGCWLEHSAVMWNVIAMTGDFREQGKKA